MQSVLTISVVMVFYKIIINTELATLKCAAPRKYRVSFSQTSVYDIFINQSIYNFVLCVLLFKDYM